MSWDLISFIAASPSSFHAAEFGAHMLKEAGFVQQEESKKWDASPGGHFLLRGGALVAWFVPETASTRSGFRVIGAHTDSPGFKLKFNPDLRSHTFGQAAVEVYGGPILASWFDRELVLAGKIGLADGSTKLVSTSPLLRIPHLAIHLDRSANDSFSIDRQRHVQPIFSVGADVSVLDVVAQAAGVGADQIVSHDLITVDAQPGEIFGHNSELLAAGRLDNLSSVFAGLQAFLQATSAVTIEQSGSDDVLVLACFDHEEIGSASTTGAAGPLLEDVLTRTACALGADFDQTRQMFARSSCVSADAAHSVHPNYPERHDQGNFPVLGEGPVLKVNANQRYASNTETEALWVRACRAAGVDTQVFVGNNVSPCGSTIGPITATRLGIPTVDVGVPLLSMHSARELCHVRDMELFEKCLVAYLVA